MIVDAEDYFTHLRAAMLKARRRIVLVGWDFDARIAFAGGGGDGGPEAIGEFITWLVRRRPELQVHILRWDTGTLKALFHAGTLLTVLRWIRDPQIHLKLDSHHPVAGSHHQKVVVIDDDVAFCGGIDMTRRRWDSRAHADHEPRRRNPDGSPYGPWHDAAMALEGPAARALGDMSRERWRAAGGRKLEPVETGGDCWPDDLAPDFQDVEVGISRTLPAMRDCGAVHEIEELYVALIARARRWIYAESQYFASRRIAEAIARRLHEADGPEVVIVNPITADGWLEPIAMDSARARLVAALRECDLHNRFRIYHPVTAAGRPIYVHAKVMVIDDEILRVSSSNFNNRSLRLDTECDVTLDPAGDDPAGASSIRRIRNALLAEHLGSDPATVEAILSTTGSLIVTIAGLSSRGRGLQPFEHGELPAVQRWLADTKLLDPEGPAEMFEPLARRTPLLKRLLHRHDGAGPPGGRARS
ncbi:phospholipase D-like domain-containing protein [Sphingomonas sp. MA1305]|uniref:phospholipase D-like domain-containing protein n=1 Tax=Sphingomonas sp. MA1305 TaxID=2479204 RepID=UPI001E4F97A5|nr:phospholipase D-like domain-containing protein [Sphingomonas sp. MA1305]